MTMEEAREARRISTKKWRDAHPEQAKENCRKWKEANSEQVKAAAKRWAEAHPRCPVKRRARMLKKSYNLLPAEFDSMMEKQSSRCGICSELLSKPFIDHCHKTNSIRGLLCCFCNTGLGNFKDSPERLVAAIKYLRNWGEPL